MDIILASKSKRRIEMMDELGFKYRAIASTKDEIIDYFKSHEEIVKNLAKSKALDIYNDHKDSLVLGFDTLVFLDDEILGKPKDKDDCIRMIKMLRGRTHEVITGAYIIKNGYKESFASKSLVTFLDISDEEIEEYALKDEAYDKAGGYAVQGYIGRFISHIDGDIFSIIGMPKARVYQIIKECLNK